MGGFTAGAGTAGASWATHGAVGNDGLRRHTGTHLLAAFAADAAAAAHAPDPPDGRECADEAADVDVVTVDIASYVTSERTGWCWDQMTPALPFK